MYPRYRKETSDPLSVEEVSEALRAHWGKAPVRIRGEGSKKVHFVEWPDRSVVFRANAGWDGTMAPPAIVRFLDHLSRHGAPVPAIVPTSDGRLHAQLRDWTLSVESLLPGKCMRDDPCRFLSAVGGCLARIHEAAFRFPEQAMEIRPAAEYAGALFKRALSRELSGDEKQAIEAVRRDVDQQFGDASTLGIPWTICHGDLASHNVLCTDTGCVRFTDFDNAAFAPALSDLVMTRFQWSMSRGLLTNADASDLLTGYCRERPLSASEVSCFVLVWAAYYTDRITFLLDRRRKQRGPWAESQREHYRAMVLRLPAEAIRMGREAQPERQNR